MNWGDAKQVFDKVLTFNYKKGASAVYWIIGAVLLLGFLAVLIILI